MSHEIDTSNSRENIAYIGETPWHGLGQKLTPDADIETWRREAGLNFEVRPAGCLFADENGNLADFAERRVLYRDDTKAPLSVVSKDYNIVQPGEILDFVAQCVKHAGFQMEVAGSLMGGRKVWALARVNDGEAVVGHDVVRPYILAATSFDSTLSSTFKFTAIRVVCDNTITMAAGGRDVAGGGQTESDTTEGPVVQCVRVPHSAKPNFDEIRSQLGIVFTAWERFLVDARLLAGAQVSDAFAAEFFKTLLAKERTEEARKEAEAGRTFAKLMAIAKGELPSATLPEARGTLWGILNACSWYTDHERGSDATRLNSAWFGGGEGLKNRAFALAREIVHA